MQLASLPPTLATRPVAPITAPKTVPTAGPARSGGEGPLAAPKPEPKKPAAPTAPVAQPLNVIDKMLAQRAIARELSAQGSPVTTFTLTDAKKAGKFMAGTLKAEGVDAAFVAMQSTNGRYEVVLLGTGIDKDTLKELGIPKALWPKN